VDTIWELLLEREAFTSYKIDLPTWHSETKQFSSALLFVETGDWRLAAGIREWSLAIFFNFVQAIKLNTSLKIL